jgi:hypothetical protein
MGSGASSNYQPLSNREISKLQKRFPLNYDGLLFFHVHYSNLMMGINNHTTENDPISGFKLWILEKV